MFRKLTKKTPRDKEGEWTKHDDKVLQAIQAGDVEKLQGALSKKGTSAIKMDPDGKVPLHEAAKLGQDGCLEVLLQTGVNVGVADTHGLTPLHYTSMGGFVIPTQRLLHARASVRSKDLSDKSPLHYAVLGGHLEVTKILLDAKAELDAKEEYGKTALMMASQQGHLALCKELIERGANVNTQEQLLKTSLMIACEHGRSDVVDLLIKRGARADLTDAHGFDAAYYAKASGQDDVKSHLESAPSVATWDVAGDDDESDEPKADAVDDIADFDMSNVRTDSPITVQHENTKNQKEIEQKQQTNGISRDDSSEIRELEEENEVLNEELRQANLDNKKALDRVASLEQQIMHLTSGVRENTHNKEYENELEMVKAQLAEEKNRNTKASEELSALRARLGDTGSSDDGGDADNDSWGDSDEGDLFDLPSTGVSPSKTKVLRKSTSSARSSDSKIISRLETEITELKMHNNDLKQRLELGNAEMVPQSEYEDLRRTTEVRISLLEEEIGDLKDELQQKRNKTVSPEDYEELKNANKRESRIMQEQFAMLAEEMASTTEKLANVTDDNHRLKGTLSRGSNHQIKALLQEKSELEEAINKYTVSMADQAEEVQRLHKKTQEILAEKIQLQEHLNQKTDSLQTKTLEYGGLEKECIRLQNMISKQSKAIATQNEKARKDKKTLVDLMSEKETLAEELYRLKSDSGTNGEEGLVSKVKYDEVMEENRTLKETISSQESTLQGSQGDRDKLDFLTKENWRLQGALRRQEDAMSKKHGELKRYKKLVQAQGGKGTEEFSKYMEELDAENLKLQEELDRCKEELHNKEADAKKYAQLQSENERLREEASSKPKVVAETAADKKQYKKIMDENWKLKDELRKQEEAKQENGAMEMGVGRLEKEVEELNGKLLETVRVYRMHLLCAVQGKLDPEVKTALMEIVKLRNNGHSVA